MYLKNLLPLGMAGSRDSNIPRLVSIYLFIAELYIGRVHPHCGTFTSSSRVTPCSVLKPTGKRMLSFLYSPIDLNWSQFPFVWMGSCSTLSLWPERWSRLTRVGLVNMSIPGAGVTVMPIKSYGPRVGESGVLIGKSEEGESFRKKRYKIQE